jgi:hypothetical protein
MVGFFTRLAALVGPSLPRLLGEEEGLEEEGLEEEGEQGGPTGVKRQGGRGAAGEVGVSYGRLNAPAAGQRGPGPGARDGPLGRRQQEPQEPPSLPSLSERAALRQLVVRMTYDACR